MDAFELLLDLGFSEYEARAYVALLKRSPLNGYELAKHSDVPRGNIYGVLQKLEERGAVVRVDTPEGARYAPVSSDEMLAQIEGRFRRTVGAAGELLRLVARPADPVPVSNLRGYDAVLDHARALARSARRSLLLAVWPDEAKALAGEVTAATERGVGVRTLCLGGCAQECGACRGEIHRHRLMPDEARRWLVVLPDREEVIAAEMASAQAESGADDATHAVRTRQRLMVDLTASYIQHSIILARILEDAGAGLNDLLSAETRALLKAIGDEEGRTGWLARAGQLWGDEKQEIEW